MSTYLLCIIYHKIDIIAAQKFERFLGNNFMGVSAVKLRFVVPITVFLCCILGISFAAERDKNFSHIFKNLGHGDFEKGLDHVWKHADGGNGTATLLLSRLFLEFGDVENFEKVLPQDLIQYGFIPELIGRLPVISSLNTLDEKSLLQVLTEPKNSLLKQYKTSIFSK